MVVMIEAQRLVNQHTPPSNKKKTRTLNNGKRRQQRGGGGPPLSCTVSRCPHVLACFVPPLDCPLWLFVACFFCVWFPLQSPMGTKSRSRRSRRGRRGVALRGVVLSRLYMRRSMSACLWGGGRTDGPDPDRKVKACKADQNVVVGWLLPFPSFVSFPPSPGPQIPPFHPPLPPCQSRPSSIPPPLLPPPPYTADAAAAARSGETRHSETGSQRPPAPHATCDLPPSLS